MIKTHWPGDRVEHFCPFLVSGEYLVFELFGHPRPYSGMRWERLMRCVVYQVMVELGAPMC